MYGSLGPRAGTVELVNRGNTSSAGVDLEEGSLGPGEPMEQPDSNNAKPNAAVAA